MAVRMQGVLAFCCCDEILEKASLKEERLILAYGFEGLVGQLAPLFVGLWRDRISWRKAWQKKAAHFTAVRKWRNKGGV